MGDIDVKLLAAADINIALKSAANVNVVLRSAADIGINLPSDIVSAPPGYSAEYQTVYDSWIIKPIDAVAAEQNTMVEGWVNDGVWATRDVWYVLAAHTNDNGEALTNWINPGTFDATMINAPAFVAFEGFTGGATKYITTNYNLNSDGINFVMNSASMCIYSRTNRVAGNKNTIGAGDGISRAYMQLRFTGDLFLNMINDLTNPVTNNTNTTGMYIGSRTASNIKKAYRNKVLIVDESTASIAIPPYVAYVLAINFMGTPFTDTIQGSMAAFGGGLIQQNVDDLTDAFEAYMVSNGKGVIP